MLRHEKSAPIWLFSFVDLAFLLLIAFTQISPDKANEEIRLAEIEIPRIHGQGDRPRDAAGAAGWQLLIHPVAPQAGNASSDPSPMPFELVGRDALRAPSMRDSSRPAAGQPGTIDAAELEAHLALLATRHEDRPVLAPHRDSRSEDLLVAVSLVESIWQEPRRVTVRPQAPVAAAREGFDSK